MATEAAAPLHRWEIFLPPSDKTNIQSLWHRLRSMTDESELYAKGGGSAAQDSHAPRANLRPTRGQPFLEGGSRGGAGGVQGGSNPSETFASYPWVLDLIKMGLAAAFAVGFTYAVMKDGIATGQRGFEISLENRAAIAGERAARKEDLAAFKLAMEKEFHSLKTSFGKRLSDAMKPLVNEQKKMAEAVAVMAEGQRRFEDQMRNALDRIRTSRSTP